MTAALCVGEHCDGIAAPGLRVCLPDRGVVVVTIADLPSLYEDLLIPSEAGQAMRGSGSSTPLALDDRARWEREAIRLCLAFWVRVLHGKPYRVTLPADEVSAMAATLARWADRLLNTEHADQLLHDCEGLMSARWAAYPSRPAGVRVPCPECGERVRLDPAADEIRCQCGQWGTLEWWRESVAPQIGAKATAVDLVAWLLLEHRQAVDEVTIRQWASRELITRQGRDERGRMTYDPIEVATVAATLSGPRRRSRAS